MSLLTVYCDESGTDRSNRVAVVAGYIGQVSEWRYFQKEWLAVLKRYSVKTMRRADLETWQGEFTEKRGWTPEYRKAFLSELHPIIKQRTKVALAVAIIKEDWEDVMPDSLKRFFGGVYGWCAHNCTVITRVWCQQHKHKHPLNWIFESGAVGWREVSTMFAEVRKETVLREQYRFGTVSFAGKEIVPLQSADLLAYEIFKHVENQILDRGRKHPIRVSIRNLMREQDLPCCQYWDRARLREWLRTGSADDTRLPLFKEQ